MLGARAFRVRKGTGRPTHAPPPRGTLEVAEKRRKRWLA